jgi:hypothetical protein
MSQTFRWCVKGVIWQVVYKLELLCLDADGFLVKNYVYGV